MGPWARPRRWSRSRTSSCGPSATRRSVTDEPVAAARRDARSAGLGLVLRGAVARKHAVEPVGDVLDGRRGDLAEERLDVHELGLARRAPCGRPRSSSTPNVPAAGAVGSVEDEGMLDGGERGGRHERAQRLSPCRRVRTKPASSVPPFSGRVLP